MFRSVIEQCCCHAATLSIFCVTLRWRHNGHNGISNHQPHHRLLNRFSGADQRKHQSSALLAFVRRIHRWPVNSPHKGPVTRKIFRFDDVIMRCRCFHKLDVWSKVYLRICCAMCSILLYSTAIYREFIVFTCICLPKNGCRIEINSTSMI